jgi:hypothetical protein
MTIGRNSQGVIVLQGDCPVEDAETLLQHLQTPPAGPVDWSACTSMHTAVAQVLLAATPELLGACGDDFVARWLTVLPASPKAAP